MVYFNSPPCWQEIDLFQGALKEELFYQVFAEN